MRETISQSLNTLALAWYSRWVAYFWLWIFDVIPTVIWAFRLARVGPYVIFVRSQPSITCTSPVESWSIVTSPSKQTSIYFVSEICPPAYLCLKTQRAVSGNELELKGCGSFYSFWAYLCYPFLPVLRWTIWSALRTSRGHTHHFSNSVAHILFTDLALILLLVSRLASYSNVIMTDTGGTTTSFQYLQSSLVCLDCSIPHLFCNIIRLD